VDLLTFFEINPAVIDQTARYFSYVKDSLGATSIILGDARISLELAPPYHFDVLVLDAFSGDAVPSHLLTIEAFRSYQDHLAEDGVIAIHISNTHLDLKPLLRAVAAELQLAPAQIEVPRDDAIAQLGSSWFFLTRDQARYNHPNLAPFLSERNVFVPATRLWTDSFSNLWSLLR
jgi:spermidine synthase